jgi:hypothetical protein
MIELLDQYSTNQQIAMATCIIVAIVLLAINSRIGPTITPDAQPAEPEDAPVNQPVFDIDPAAFWRKE